MGNQYPRPDVIDKIWTVAANGFWHTLNRLVEATQCRLEEVVVALRFLVRYGFAEASQTGEERFRMITAGPSPREAVNLLRAVEGGAE